MQCALAKLGYLLSKTQLSIEKVRELVRLPLRGELTAPSGQSTKPSIAQHLDSLQDCLAQMMRLSDTSSPHVPQIIISPDQEPGHSADDPAAPWSWTVAEASATQSTLLNILIRLAVAKDDIDGLEFCLRYQDDKDILRSPIVEKSSTAAAGIVNSIDPSSGWTPLHVAAFNGSERSVATLLQAGALVHLRDSLGHTALYYVSLMMFDTATKNLMMSFQPGRATGILRYRGNSSPGGGKLRRRRYRGRVRLLGSR